MIDIDKKEVKGIIASDSRTMHGNSLKNIEGRAELNKEQCQERKDKLLEVFEKGAYAEELKLPILGKVLRSLDIPRQVYNGWMAKDPAFNRRFNDLMEVFDDAAVNALFNACQNKWGVAYAVSYLNYRGKLRHNINHSGQVTQIQLVSRIPDAEVFVRDDSSIPAEPSVN